MISSGFTDLEREIMTVHRWWMRDELRTSLERLVPRDLASVIDRLLDYAAPAEPLTLGS